VRRQRYRRLIVAALFAIVLLVGGMLFALGSIGSGGGGQSSVRTGRPPSAPAGAVKGQTAPAGVGVVGRGPTALDFTDPLHGWIASGNGALGNPTIVRTTDGGQSWERVPVPNLAARSVAPSTRYEFGDLVGIHFADPLRGWFLQAGIGWQTNDGGVRWTKMQFPVDGALVALTSSGDDVWALLDTCPVSAVSCSSQLRTNPSGAEQNAKGSLYHASLAGSLRWHRVGGSLAAGFGALYPTAGHSVLVALGAETYRRSVASAAPVAPTTGCQAIGTLAGGGLAGICDVGGGGNASVSRLAVSNDHGITWQPLVRGPPSSQYEGTLATNGTDAVFYVTGGQTLWRTGTSQPGWSLVLQVPQGSTDEIYPVYVYGRHGLALVSNGQDAHWFETSDGGVTWEPVTLP
jgi:hypothetical protein